MTVKVGLMLVPDADPSDVIETARRAEEQGFDFLSCGEHVLFHGPTPNAFVCLAAAAAVTTRMRLLSALTIVPLYPTGLLAKMATTLDRLSCGRFDLGVGVGGEYPPEFAACGVPVPERGARTDEALEICTRLFAGQKLMFDGSYARIDGYRLDPLPVQQDGPPLWVGGRSDAAMRRAGKYGTHWLPYMMSPRQLREGLERVRDTAEAAGRPRAAVSGAIYAWTAAHPDPAVARFTALETLGEVYQQDFAMLADRYVPTGTPEQVADRLAEYVDAGAESVLLSPACSTAEFPGMVTRFAEDILPRLQALPTPRRTQSTGATTAGRAKIGGI